MFRHLPKWKIFKNSDTVYRRNCRRSYVHQILDHQETIRNIGILAHIDAGKKLTLYLSIMYTRIYV